MAIGLSPDDRVLMVSGIYSKDKFPMEDATPKLSVFEIWEKVLADIVKIKRIERNSNEHVHFQCSECEDSN